MASAASIGGHPIHPMIIPFPIALWVFSLVADIIYLWRGNPIWRDWIAFYTLLGGILGAAVAAVPGLIDWLSLKDREVVRIANWHARLNVIALLIFAGSFYLRTTSGTDVVGGNYSIPFMLSVVGVILITISGWLGGEMVFDPAEANEKPVAGQGHLHYQVDDGPIIATTTMKLSFHGLTPGAHKIVVTLAGNDHSPLGPQETLNVTIP